ncbi:related to secreted protein-Streptomyces sviceus [Serendipita indica DSM 11827]|uniref:Related to secreted protein-Streptomyces sviceus n=1 Tax=Serendipita indica (strain DSM 11827) TaxID=1109443 RepID=G4TSL9_SERID|nr:related to secreted protein-Streptomyces sviceus [Serendipita indica DSM 11827]
MQLLALSSFVAALFAGALAYPSAAVNITARAPASFVHPGVLLNTAQLNFIRSKVNAGAQPWSNAYTTLLNEQLLSQSRTPSPRSVVNCGPSSNPNNGCTDERQDALAAYGNALAWYVSQDSKYAKKAISYFNAWSGVITDHTGDNAPLQTGWSGTSWARAAEIIRYTYTGWASSDITKFENMLRNVYLPEVINGDARTGNWDLVMMEAAQGIAVFLNDKTSYDKAMNRYLGRVPAFVYLDTDGSYPKAAPGSPQTTKAQIISFWQGQTTFVNGIAQETCRDFVHTGYGIASIGHVAETSRIQGTDLYTGDIGTRLRYALGFHSLYQLGASVPSWLCDGTLTLGLGPVTEIGFNAMNTRLGFGMTNTQTLTQNQRPAGTNWLFLGWETLTHAGNTA